MAAADDLLVCATCGTLFDIPADQPLSACRICDDPRQFVPPEGQQWTSLARLKHGVGGQQLRNALHPDPVDPRVTSIVTEPKFGIGQRCILLETPAGNVLWDCITLLDDDTVAFIRAKGGLAAIVISHPHYYTTHLQWARAFDCPVYIAAEDEGWVNVPDPDRRRRLVRDLTHEIVPGVLAIKLGGHFPGSLVLLWETKLFIADTLVTVPSALYHIDRPPGTISYVYMWSIVNMIALPPSELHQMWQRLKLFHFESTHGAFTGMEVRDRNVKRRVLESMKIQVRAQGHSTAAIFDEEWP